jgi:methyl-accepting chemotaxis protein
MAETDRSMAEVDRSSLRHQYEEALWWTMDVLGISESIERKVFAAVLIQFGVTVLIFVLPFVVSGVAWYLLSGLLFLGAVVAGTNTLLVVRRDLTEPVCELERKANAIAAGDLETTIDRSGQADEVGSLTAAFAEMQAHLATVSRQADALARQEFDDPALAEDVPGAFGESLSRMAENLEAYTTELEEMTERLDRRSRRLEALVDRFGEATERAQDGDLTATIDPGELTLEDETYVELVENYNALVTTLGETLGDVQTFAGEVSAASDDVAMRMDEVDDASDQVARSVGEISDGAARQTGDLQAVSREMNTLSTTVEQIATSADEAAETAAGTARRSRDGRDAAEEAMAELDQLEAGISETATAVETLVDRIDEIDGIVSFIDDVAEQTNLLALNAGIEAARAGEAGEGFAVVADEVKALAEETQESAAEISDRIEEIQEASRATVADVQRMETQVSDSVGTIETTLHNFEDIVDEIDAVNTTIQEISDATDEQAETTQGVVGMVDEVASVSEETTAEAENVAAAAQEQTATVSDVTGSVRELSERADDLQSVLVGFTVEEPADRAVRRRAASAD